MTGMGSTKENEMNAVVTAGPLRGLEVKVIDEYDNFAVVTFDDSEGNAVRRSVKWDSLQVEPTVGPDTHWVDA